MIAGDRKYRELVSSRTVDINTQIAITEWPYHITDQQTTFEQFISMSEHDYVAPCIDRC